MLSATDMRGNSATFWKVRPMPMSQMRCGGRVEDARALHQDVALARLVEPAQAIEQASSCRRRSGRSIRGSGPALIERNVVQRDDAAEHNAHLANGKQDVPLRCYGSVHVWRPVAGVERLILLVARHTKPGEIPRSHVQLVLLLYSIFLFLLALAPGLTCRLAHPQYPLPSPPDAVQRRSLADLR